MQHLCLVYIDISMQSPKVEINETKLGITYI